jgi:hypothetical protein
MLLFLFSLFWSSIFYKIFNKIAPDNFIGDFTKVENNIVECCIAGIFVTLFLFLIGEMLMEVFI